MAFTSMLKERIALKISPRRMRILRESLAGYLFIAPSLIVTTIRSINIFSFQLAISNLKKKNTLS